MSESVDQHSLVLALKDLAIELGRTPTRDEFISRVRCAKDKVLVYFGSHAAFVQAAGLDPVQKKSKVSEKDFFKRDLEQHLLEYTPRVLRSQVQYPRAAIISDIHWPFASNRVLERFYRYVESEKPDHVIIAGDAWDMYSHAKFPRSHNYFTPEQEEQMARKLNEEFWSEIKRVHPHAQCYQLMGNHDVRPAKRAREDAFSIDHHMPRIMRELYSFEGVTTFFDSRDELVINDVMFHHGYRSKLGDHRDYVLQSIVVGHTHMPGVVWRKIRGGQLFEMNCGLAGDPESKGLSYTAQKTTIWVNAFGVIDEDGPRNIVI